ncbi:hypothetical protein I3843_12G040000 [Carya illinoinensis]|nr:hypothetical protein I3843_12G040000 [Carya illinoinensis]
MVKLQTLKLDNNFFNTSLPTWFDSLSNLTIPCLRNNQLKCPFPSSILSISALTNLIISSNDISGELPHLSSLNRLHVLDLSANKLHSVLPQLPKGVVMVFLNNNSFSAKSYCEEVVNVKKQSKGKNAGILVGVIVGIVLLMVFLALGFIFLWRCYCPRGISEQHLLQNAVQDSSAAGFSSELLANATFISEAAKLGMQGLPACRSFSLDELKEATNNFDSSAFMGEGSCGKASPPTFGRPFGALCCCWWKR